MRQTPIGDWRVFGRITKEVKGCLTACPSDGANVSIETVCYLLSGGSHERLTVNGSRRLIADFQLLELPALSESFNGRDD